MIRKRECGEYLVVFQDVPPNGMIILVDRHGWVVRREPVGVYGMDPLDWGVDWVLKDYLEGVSRREELSEAAAAWGRLHADS